MRLLIVADYYRRGSSRVVEDRAAALAARGHGVTLLAGCPPSSLDEEGRAAAELGLESRLVPWDQGRRGLRALLALVRSFRSAFEDLAAPRNFEAVLFNQPLSAWAVMGSPRWLRTPALYTFHSPWAHEWAIERGIDVSGGRPASGIRGRLEFAARRWIEGSAIARSRKVTVLSEYMRRLLLEHHPREAPAKVALIPGGVNLGRFRPQDDGRRRARKASLGIPPDAPLVLTVRRLVPRMGLESLLRAFGILRAEFEGIRLAIGGAGPLEGRLRALAGSLGLDGSARFLGFVPEGALPGLYAAADLFVVPTAQLEGFGLVTAEALACGTPVVGTPVGATPDILRAVDPRLVARDAGHRSIADAAAAILRLQPVERRAIGALGRRHMALFHDSEDVGDRLESLLSAVSGGSLRRGRPDRIRKAPARDMAGAASGR